MDLLETLKKMESTIVNILEYIRMKSNIATKIISSILHDKSKTFACDIWFKIFARYGTPYDKKLDEWRSIKLKSD